MAKVDRKGTVRGTVGPVDFSPCAIIAAFEAAIPDEYPARPVSLELSEEQMIRKRLNQYHGL